MPPFFYLENDMPRYQVVFPTMMYEGKKYVRGDIIESDIDLGIRVELLTEPVKPKAKKTRKKVVIDEGE